jgi:general secretion pathway protein K
MTQRSQQRGSVIIVTLWTITVMTILITVMASQSRLSAQVAYAHQQELHAWAAISSAVNQAESDLMLEHMTPPVDDDERQGTSADDLNQALQDRFYRYNGDELELYYPQAETVAVRIYEEAGKINLQRISRARLRSLLEKKLGGPDKADERQLDELMEAWNDWLDLNEDASASGADNQYYEALDVPFTPRNGAFETVEEVLLIRGFAEVFADVNLNAAFTLYGDDDLLNLNLATVEAMQLLPGLNDELIAEILKARAEKAFAGPGDVAQIVPTEAMADLRLWLNLSKKTTPSWLIRVTRTLPTPVTVKRLTAVKPATTTTKPAIATTTST